MTQNNYRALSFEEIAQLEAHQCMADDWSNILVAREFKPDYIFHTRFSGNIRMGVFEKEFILPGGLKKHSGLRHVTLHNCTLGDNILIENVQNYIANYKIGSDSCILNANVIYVEGESTFGNGVEVAVLNETGGREVPIYNELSASLAYIIALYRHRTEVIVRIKEMITAYTRKITSISGTIGKGVRIINAATIRNVNIGDYATVENVSKLGNGSINSTADDPVYVGDSVIAEDFILSSGAVLSDAAKIIRCFVGQACHISHNYSAHDSLIFANCGFENGEACAIFAGPFTVSMHKSSLLIAGMFSFSNAGSGSNQSNHMYKLGPIHQGIVERGSKTTSDSYILWPAKIGAFSLVMGRHYRHTDSSEIPFSYLIENSDETYLVPGANLKSVGTIRDAQKWPKRDKRKDPRKLDCINYNLLSPYTVGKMVKAIGILKNLQEISGETSEIYYFRSARIKNSSLKTGLKLYEMALDKFLGNSLISRLEKADINNVADIRKTLQPEEACSGCEDEWVDLSGLFAPRSEIELLLKKIEEGEISTLEEIEETFRRLQRDYYSMEWVWALNQIEGRYGVSRDTMTTDDVIRIVSRWKEAVVTMDNLLYSDAKKEFSLISKIGFGVDGSDHDKMRDFECVRGDFEKNPFVQSVKEHILVKSALGDAIISKVRNIRN
ncbi:MAG: DUF4954 family protein [Bacteroidales bacterium]|nr:DUF4954 family protein [Bacteroidales bacterium]